MSMNKHTYAMTGIRRTQEQLKGSGIDILGDDKFLPLIEGHEGSYLSAEYGEGDDFVYIGKIVASSEPYSDYVSQELQFPSHQEVANHLDQFGFDVCGSDVKNWFFDVCR